VPRFRVVSETDDNYYYYYCGFSFGEIPSAPRGAGCQPPVGPCPNSKYRTIDGSCNNLRYTNWGIPNSKYARLLPPKYSDGEFAFRDNVENNDVLAVRFRTRLGADSLSYFVSLFERDAYGALRH